MAWPLVTYASTHGQQWHATNASLLLMSIICAHACQTVAPAWHQAHCVHAVQCVYTALVTHRSSSRTSGVSSLAITPRKPGEHALWRSEGGVGGGAAGKDASSAPGAGKGAEAAAAAPKSELWKLWAALG
jgi:hypothetical protein